ncbi:iron-containing alcohol dehydrogenase [Chloroflexota bacterium]
MITERELTFVFQSAIPKMVYGRDTIPSLWEELEILNTRRAMVVCGPNILRKSNVITRVQEALREKYIGLFPEVEEHSPVQIINRGAEVARELKPDVLISVGGGSTHDTTKGIATVLAERKDMRECLVKFEPPDKFIQPSLTKPKMPIVAVPTTLGCAEFSPRGSFTDKEFNIKLLKGDDDKVIPKVVVVDGLALATTPVPIHMANGMSQIRAHIHRVCSERHNPITDALALHGIKLLNELLPQIAGGDVDVVLKAKIAGALSYFGPRSGIGNLIGFIAHEIPAVCNNVTHGIAMAIMLPHTMRFSLDAEAERQRLVAQALGIDTSGLSDAEAGLAAAEAIVAMTRMLGLPTRLRDVSVRQEDLEAIARATMAHSTRPSDRKTAGKAQILDLLHKAW